jgi:hypothetical protein
VELGPISDRKETFLETVARFSTNAEAQVIAAADGLEGGRGSARITFVEISTHSNPLRQRPECTGAPGFDNCAPSLTVRIWFAETFSSFSFSPLGQRISSSSTFEVAPRPKCKRKSLYPPPLHTFCTCWCPFARTVTRAPIAPRFDFVPSTFTITQFLTLAKILQETRRIMAVIRQDFNGSIIVEIGGSDTMASMG